MAAEQGQKETPRSGKGGKENDSHLPELKEADEPKNHTGSSKGSISSR